MVKSEPLSYTIENKHFIGHLTYSSKLQGKKPAVILVPTWMGLNDFLINKTKEIADLGLIAYGVDLFGQSQVAQNRDEALTLITPLVLNRQIIIKRLKTAIETLKKHPQVDPSKIAAIGFCFGGTCVLELAKNGYPLLGVVSFHPVLGNPYNLPMQPIETASTIPASILLLLGYKDPLSSLEDLQNFEKEMSSKGADWQVTTYSETMHGFTNPKANRPEEGIQYHELASKRAFIAMKNFLNELFGPIGGEKMASF